MFSGCLHCARVDDWGSKVKFSGTAARLQTASRRIWAASVEAQLGQGLPPILSPISRKRQDAGSGSSAALLCTIRGCPTPRQHASGPVAGMARVKPVKLDLETAVCTARY